MTNKQISKIKSEYLVMDEYGYTDKELVDTVNMLVDKVNELVRINTSDLETLEQQPSEDTISRQTALEPYQTLDDNDVISVWMIRKNIEQMPPVTPQRKTGTWVRTTDAAGREVWECDKCGWQQRFANNYCPDCGAIMMNVI